MRASSGLAVVGMMGIGAISLGGCAKLDLPPEEPSSCVSSVSLDGSTSSEPADVGPIALGTADICMHLDASRNQVSAHLGVTVGFDQPGSQSGFATTLVDLDGVTLREGWDVQISDRVVHTLEWSLEAGEVRDVVLHVTNSGSAVATSVQVALFEPLD
jgi:hypothetical protein